MHDHFRQTSYIGFTQPCCQPQPSLDKQDGIEGPAYRTGRVEAEVELEGWSSNGP